MKKFSPAAERNQSFILEALSPYLSAGCRVLEIASGTGQHAAYMTTRRPDILWQGSDPDEESFASLKAFQEDQGNNFLKPIPWNVRDEIPASIGKEYDLIVNINMIHISPWEACLELLDKTKVLLRPNGILYFYGPFIVEGEETASSNEEFDNSLRMRNSAWGLRSLNDVVKQARLRGLEFVEVVKMPANNLSLIFRKAE